MKKEKKKKKTKIHKDKENRPRDVQSEQLDFFDNHKDEDVWLIRNCEYPHEVLIRWTRSMIYKIWDLKSTYHMW